MVRWGPRLVSAFRTERPGSIARKVQRHLWSDRTFLILRCDLQQLGEEPTARIPVDMQPVDLAEFSGFREELERVSGPEADDLLSREKTRARGIEGLYTSFSPSGEPVFSQWLMRPQQDRISAGILQAPLRDDEVLIEGAYTFATFRGLGAMRVGMYQLLTTARDEGYRWAFTGVGAENVPSLRGCSRVGFTLDYVRRSTGHLGHRTRNYDPPRAADAATWQAAIGPS